MKDKLSSETSGKTEDGLSKRKAAWTVAEGNEETVTTEGNLENTNLEKTNLEDGAAPKLGRGRKPKSPDSVPEHGPPKKRRGRPPKATGATSTIATEYGSPKKRRGRPPKAKGVISTILTEGGSPKKRRGRPPKTKDATSTIATESEANNDKNETGQDGPANTDEATETTSEKIDKMTLNSDPDQTTPPKSDQQAA